MALYGLPDTVRSQLRYPRALEAAWSYVAEAVNPKSAIHRRITSVDLGKTVQVELGEGCFALEQAYLSKQREHAYFESHKTYIDFQVVVKGQEIMEVAPVGGLTVKEDFTPGRDLLFYWQAGRASQLWVRAGEMAVFFPEDAHRPSLASEVPVPVWKTVLKIPVL